MLKKPFKEFKKHLHTFFLLNHIIFLLILAFAIAEITWPHFSVVCYCNVNLLVGGVAVLMLVMGLYYGHALRHTKIK